MGTLTATRSDPGGARFPAIGWRLAKRRSASHGGVVVAYELRGRILRRHRPWLVLIQGLGFDRTGWGPALRLLGRRFRLVLVDNRGSGDSDAPPGPYSVADMAGDVLAVLDDASIRRAHVLGTSLGGMVAQELAIRHPHRVDRLVLVGSTPGWGAGVPFPTSNLQLLWETAGLPADVATRRRVEYAMAPMTVADRPGLVDAVTAHQRARGQAVGPRRAQMMAGAAYTNALRDVHITAPTLVVHGACDNVVDPRNGDLLRARIPQARLAVVPDAGHLVTWEQPDHFAAVVTHFLEQGT